MIRPRRHETPSLHSDVETLMRSMRGHRCFVSFTHEGTNHVSAFKMKKKTEVLTHLKTFMQFSERCLGARMMEFRADGDGSHMSQELSSCSSSMGMRANCSTPHRPEQNGEAERAMQTLMGMVKSHMKTANTSETFWCHVVMGHEHLNSELFAIRFKFASIRIHESKFHHSHANIRIHESKFYCSHANVRRMIRCSLFIQNVRCEETNNSLFVE